MYAPIFLIHVVKNFSINKKFWKNFVIGIFIIGLLFFIKSKLPYDQSKFNEVKGINL
jgi:hypothetical protein